VQVIDARSDRTFNSDDFDSSSRLSTRAWLSTKPVVSKLGQSQSQSQSQYHTGVIAPWTGGTWLPEYDDRNCREPAASRWCRQCSCAGNNEATIYGNPKTTTTNKLTVILSAVDLPSYTSSRSALHCECQTTLDVRCLMPCTNSWRCRGMSTAASHSYVRVASPGERLRKHAVGPDGRTWSRSSNRSVHYDDDDDEVSPTSFNPSPEPFARRESPVAGNDRPAIDSSSVRSVSSGRTVQYPPSPATSQGSPGVTERRVYTLARAYSNRVKKLQRRSASSQRQNVDDDDRREGLQAQRVRAHSSTSTGRRTALPLSPALLYS